MNIKKYEKIKSSVIIFIITIITISIFSKLYLLAVVGILTGILFFSIVRFKTDINIDEREQEIKEKAANITYAIFVPTISIGSFLLLVPSLSKLSVFFKGEFIFTETLGVIFAYLTLFLITVYTISYFFLNRKFGGKSDEK